MALVASVQRLAPLLSSVLTSERPRMHFQHRQAGEAAPTCPTQLGSEWGLGSEIRLSPGPWELSDSHRNSILFPAFAHVVPSLQNVLSVLTS